MNCLNFTTLIKSRLLDRFWKEVSATQLGTAEPQRGRRRSHETLQFTPTDTMLEGSIIIEAEDGVGPSPTAFS